MASFRGLLQGGRWWVCAPGDRVPFCYALLKSFMEYHIYFSAHFSSCLRFFPFLYSIGGKLEAGPLECRSPFTSETSCSPDFGSAPWFYFSSFYGCENSHSQVEKERQVLGAELGLDQELDHAVLATPGAPEDCGLVSTW